MIVDLHTHSTASDGSERPSRVIELAVEAGLGVIALTDHDTLEGIPEAAEAASGLDIELIPGVELSLEYDRGGMHMLVLWLDDGPGPLQDRLEAIRTGRANRNVVIVERLNDLGMDVTLEEIEEESGGGSVGRPHIAAVLMRKGYVPDIKSAFDMYLAHGKPAHVPRDRLEPADAVRLARQSGGVPILAHPHTLNITTKEDMSELLEGLVEAGLIGLESYYSSYRPHERYGYADLARRFDLVPTGGSDFHGSYKPGLALGSGYGDLAVDGSVVDQLKARR